LSRQSKHVGYTESLLQHLEAGLTTERFLTSARLETREFIMLLISLTHQQQHQQQSGKSPIQNALTCILESLQLNNETTLSDRLHTWNPSIPELQSLKTLVQHLTLNVEGFSLFLNAAKKESLTRWWSPVKTDCVALDSTCSSGSSDSTMLNSWFSIGVTSPLNRSLPKTSLPSSRSLHAGGPEDASTQLRTRKVRLKLTSLQKKLLHKWSDHYRYTYNKTMWLATETREYNKLYLRNLVVPSEVNQHIPWILETPKGVRESGCFDALSNLKACFTNLANKNITHFTVPYKKKRNASLSWSFGIPKTAIRIVNDRTLSIYPDMTSSYFRTTESVKEVSHDCKIHYDGLHYYILIPVDIKKKNPDYQQQHRVCAIDPGVRTFLTVYDPENGCIEIGKNVSSTLQPILQTIDYLNSLKDRSSSTTRKRKLDKKIRRWRLRITNLQNELHNKASNFLVKNYSKIYLPKLETTRLSRRTAHRKLSSTSVRMMNTLRHSQFFDITKTKGVEYNSDVIVASEEYTSKTCSVCGSVNDVGASKTYTCGDCCSVLDRDMNAAKNIFVLNHNCQIQPL
jgi:putative transposase